MKFYFLVLLIIGYLCMLEARKSNEHKNVLGDKLQTCSLSPLTGFRRTGKCETDERDYGTHLVCATVTKEFLEYTKSKGNDLSTPRRYFRGLKPGNNWCLCVFRW